MTKPQVEWKGKSLFVNGRYAGYYSTSGPCSSWEHLWNEKGYHEFPSWHLLIDRCKESLEKQAIERFGEVTNESDRGEQNPQCRKG